MYVVCVVLCLSGVLYHKVHLLDNILNVSKCAIWAMWTIHIINLRTTAIGHLHALSDYSAQFFSSCTLHMCCSVIFRYVCTRFQTNAFLAEWLPIWHGLWRDIGFLVRFPQLLFFSPFTSKGKAIPLHAWTGPEGSRRLRLPDFKTFGTWRW
jgi:hypothetical protein